MGSFSLTGKHDTPLELYLSVHAELFLDTLDHYLTKDDDNNLKCGQLYSYYSNLRSYTITLDLTNIDGKKNR